MKNIIRRMFGGGSKPAVKLLAVTPPREGSRTMLGVENMVGSIAVPEPFTLEIAGDSGGVSLMARCSDNRVVRQQLGARYPQAQLEEVSPEEDPVRLEEGEQAWSTVLRLQGPEYLPLRTFRDDDLLDQGSDPLIGLIGSMSDLERGERVVSRLHLNSLGPDWAQAHVEKLKVRSAGERTVSDDIERSRAERGNIARMAVMAVALLAGLKGYMWVQSGEWWKAALLGLGAATALALAGWVVWRIKKANRASAMRDPVMIEEKTSRPAFEAHLEVTAILSSSGSAERAEQLLGNVVAAYRSYDNAAGARFSAGRVKPAVPVPSLEPPRRGMLRGRNVLGVREVAALWHPPGARDEMPMVRRSGAKVLLPSSDGVDAGAHVGSTTAGKRKRVHFPHDVLGRHHLYVARTRMGKSTLMQHLVVHKMNEKAAGRDGDAIVVVDPHADLVHSLLAHVPGEIADSVRLIDLADESRAPGINLLDTSVFSDRDRTVDSVVRVAKGIWDQWGPRMQSILEHIVKSLHEANMHPSVRSGEQYTLIDGLRMLSDRRFRARVLGLVDDPYVLEWWATTFLSWSRNYSADSIAPVQTRLSYYATSKRARAILGQPESTIDLHGVISEGGVLLVSTSQATAGRDVAALVGASILNLVDSVIRGQGALSPDSRRGALVVVDEMQSMPGVDYESMLSELGKFGASFVLATQSLAGLDSLSPTMRESLLANVGCLVVFQSAASAARELVWELDRDRVTEEDIVSLPSHHCYVRASVGGERLPTFSMELRKPGDGDPHMKHQIEAAASGYTTPGEVLAAREAQARLRVQAFREEMARLQEESEETPPDGGGNSTDPGKRRRPRTRRRREENTQADGEEAQPDEEEGESE